MIAHGHVPPGYFWCEFFEGTHYSTDFKRVNNKWIKIYQEVCGSLQKTKLIEPLGIPASSKASTILVTFLATDCVSTTTKAILIEKINSHFIDVD